MRDVRVGKEVGEIMAPMSMFSLLLVLGMGSWGWGGGWMDAPWRRKWTWCSRSGIKRS